jgi:Bacterial inner membrane protein
MSRTLIDLLGWAATAVFVGSYFFARARTLRRVQVAGALMWTAYGTLLHAAPVVVANLLVLAAAVWTSRSTNVPVSRAPAVES